MSSPILNKSESRIIIIDVLRGFALLGVLIVNSISFVNQQTPTEILDSSSSLIDRTIILVIDILFEWKFMTLFSILFGYGFGILIVRFENKSLNPSLFFARRMFWLFIFGMIHTLFWWGDILHLYAISGIILLLFTKKSKSFLVLSAIAFLLIIPICISWLFRNQTETFTDNDIKSLYENYKYGNLLDIFKSNLNFYYKNFIVSGNDLHDIAETLGRFLFGYFLLKTNLFEHIESKKVIFKKTIMVTVPFMLLYVASKLSILKFLPANSYVESIFVTLGILSTTCFYASSIILLFISFKASVVFTSLQSLGRMTLTNYLLISALLVMLLYGFGFGLLGNISILEIFFFAIATIFIEIVFSLYWLRINNYGPIEWIWKQFTYNKKIRLKR